MPNPTSRVASCSTLTHDAASSPPPLKYETRTSAENVPPSSLGTPAIASKAQAIAISCPASSDSVPTHSTADTSTRTERSKRHSRKSPTV